MRRILLVRHAKAKTPGESVPDIDRPLSEKGYAQAYAMVASLAKKNFGPRLFLSSPAIRALSTALIFSRSGLYDDSEIKLIPSLYESNENEYLRIIRAVPDDYEDVFLFAHNPTISGFLNSLTEDFSVSMSTCNVAIVECKVSRWSEVDFGTGKSIELLKPELP